MSRLLQIGLACFCGWVCVLSARAQAVQQNSFEAPHITQLERRLALQRVPDALGLGTEDSASSIEAEVRAELAARDSVLWLDPTNQADAELALIAALRQRGLSFEIERNTSGGRIDARVSRLDQDGWLALHLEWRPEIDKSAASRSARVTLPFRPPGARSLWPPLLAIGLAIAFRRTVVALFAGVLLGAILMRWPDHGVLPSVVLGALDVGRKYLWERLGDPDNTRTIVFVVLMLSMVGLLVRSGGLAGVMQSIARRAESARGAQISAWLMGLFVFFDDYSNTVLVGSTMRPLFDRFRVAREKLAYIVDSTAAPVAGLSLFSTWIAFEVSTFAPQLPSIGRPAEAGFAVFLETLPYRFYCWFTLLFVGLVVVTGRDFGPMRRAEARASGGDLLRPGAKPMQSARGTFLVAAPGVVPRARRALVPLFGFLGVTISAILLRGGILVIGTPSLEGAPFATQLRALLDGGAWPSSFRLEDFSNVLLRGSGTLPLLLGSLTGFTLAAIGCWRAGIGREIPKASWAVLSSMATAFAILYLSWMMGSVCRDLETARYLTAWIGQDLAPLYFPTVLFLLASVISFATGSSWSTMMILLPLVVGLAFTLGETTALGGYALVLMSIGAVLEGSIFGDHCSPLSDTTVLSSITSASDHIDHVRTQAPYALLTMAVAILVGYLPTALLGWSPLASLGLGSAVLFAILRLWGRPKPKATASP
jgi:Na+/H+ antiporter NhaC